MSLQFITGNSGNGKTKYLFNTIVKEAKAHPRDNYLVIVPEQFTMQTQRQLVDLSENKAIMNIDVLSFKRLAYRVFDELGITNLTVLEETGKNLVLRKLAAQEADKLGVIGRNLNRIGYISEVKSLLSELVQYNISPEELGRYIDSGSLSDTLSGKLKDVLVLYEAFENFMQDIYKMDLIGFGKNVLLYYGITVVVYGVASYLICSLRYARAKKSLKCYYNNLKKLNSIYNE